MRPLGGKGLIDVFFDVLSCSSAGTEAVYLLNLFKTFIWKLQDKFKNMYSNLYIDTYSNIFLSLPFNFHLEFFSFWPQYIGNKPHS